MWVRTQAYNKLSHLMTKPTKWLCAQRRLIRLLWSVFVVRMKKACVLSYPLSAQRRLCSDWEDAQADLSLRWAHCHFVGFVVRRLVLWCDIRKHTVVWFVLSEASSLLTATVWGYKRSPLNFVNASNALTCLLQNVYIIISIIIIARLQRYILSPVKRICVFEHSVMTNFNCACPAIQRGQGSGFLSEGSSWFTACMSEQRRFWRDCADAQARLNLRCSHRQ